MSNVRVTDWDLILSHIDAEDVVRFANKQISGELFKDIAAYTDAGGAVRHLIRARGANQARVITKKALKRRQILV